VERSSSPSRSQRYVARSLEAAFPGIVLEEEGTHEATGYDLDIVLDSSRLAESGRNSVWAVEFDGPTHFLQVGRGPAICVQDSKGAYADRLTKCGRGNCRHMARSRPRTVPRF
jgi:hypothetical protein